MIIRWKYNLIIWMWYLGNLPGEGTVYRTVYIIVNLNISTHYHISDNIGLTSPHLHNQTWDLCIFDQDWSIRYRGQVWGLRYEESLLAGSLWHNRYFLCMKAVPNGSNLSLCQKEPAKGTKCPPCRGHFAFLELDLYRIRELALQHHKIFQHSEALDQ